MRTHASRLLLAAAGLALAACSGGGGDASPPTQYAVSAALNHWFTGTASWAMSGTGSDGASYTVTVSTAPTTAGPFPVDGTVAARSTQTFAIDRAGVPIGGVVQTLYFNSASGAVVGLSYDDGSCASATSNTALPASAAVGDSGAQFSELDLDSCTANAAAVGTTVNRWSLESDAGVVLMCWNLAAQDLSGVANGTQSVCVEIAADGTLGNRARYALSASGFAINARNY
jgi:hypothetical protein